MKLDHIAIIASDYQKALAFYGILGFQEIERVKRPFDIMGMLECDGVWIELFEKAAPARLTEPEALGLRHIAFATDDLDKKLEQLHPKRNRNRGNTHRPARQTIYLFEGPGWTAHRNQGGIAEEIINSICQLFFLTSAAQSAKIRL